MELLHQVNGVLLGGIRGGLHRLLLFQLAVWAEVAGIGEAGRVLRFLVGDELASVNVIGIGPLTETAVGEIGTEIVHLNAKGTVTETDLVNGSQVDHFLDSRFEGLYHLPVVEHDLEEEEEEKGLENRTEIVGTEIGVRHRVREVHVHVHVLEVTLHLADLTRKR